MSGNIPVVVKHMTLAIYEGKHPPKGASPRERFVASWAIARAHLVKYGYLRAGSEHGPTESIVLTSAGMRLEQRHLKEGDRAPKEKRFDQLYRLYLDMAVEETLPTDAVPVSESPEDAAERRLQERSRAQLQRLKAKQPKVVKARPPGRAGKGSGAPKARKPKARTARARPAKKGRR